MNIYNDFPVMSNEQYLQLKNEYAKSNNSEFIFGVKKILFELTTSLNLIGSNFNAVLSNEINKCKQDILDFSNSFYFLYPQQESFTFSKSNPNIFYVCHQLSELSIIISSQQIRESKKYYSSALLKLNHKCLNILSDLLKSLSKSEVKFYKFM